LLGALLFHQLVVIATADDDKGNIRTPHAGDLNTAARRYAAKRGWALPDGSYPIRPKAMNGIADLEDAIHAVGRSTHSHLRVRNHIIKRAKAIRGTKLLPDDWKTS
jgi:hypothetical protein